MSTASMRRLSALLRTVPRAGVGPGLPRTLVEDLVARGDRLARRCDLLAEYLEARHPQEPPAEPVVLTRLGAPMGIVELSPDVGGCELRPDGGWTVTLPRDLLR